MGIFITRVTTKIITTTCFVKKSKELKWNSKKYPINPKKARKRGGIKQKTVCSNKKQTI